MDLIRRKDTEVVAKHYFVIKKDWHTQFAEGQERRKMQS